MQRLNELQHAFRTSTSNKVDDLPLRLYVGLNVALGRAQSRMSGQHLHVF